MNNLKCLLLLLLLPTSICVAQSDASSLNFEDKKYKVRAIAELGFVGILDHKIQFGKNTTYFDYRKDGGQDVLFPATRLSLELKFSRRNTLILLYQPLKLESQVVLKEAIQIDDVFFPASSNLNLTFGFPYYRISYMRDIIFKGDKFGLALGASVQLRNATILFESSDGSLLKRNSDVGIVPLLKLRANYRQNDNMSLELEVDGIYAPISYINGTDTDVTGSLVDLSLRQNFKLAEQAKIFLNLRYVGGGAQGVGNTNTSQITDAYGKNWIHLYTVTAGLVYEF